MIKDTIKNFLTAIADYGKSTEEQEKSEIQKQIEAIDKNFNVQLEEAKTDLPESLNLKEIEYNGKTDEEIKTDAENKLTDYYKDNINDISESAEDKKKELESGKSIEEKNKEEKAGYIESVYEKAKESASNDVLKRGLARSSIAANTINDYETKKTNELTGVAKQYADNIAAIDKDIAELDTKREAAIRSFDISYAAKLAMTISDLIQERDNKIIEATKYNNTLKEKEGNYTTERLKTISELTGESYDNLKKKVEYYTETVQKLENAKTEAKYDAMLKTLNGMTKTQALKELENNPLYKDNLTSEYYEKLKLTMTVRKS